MVDTLLVYMDNSLGYGHAFTKEYAKKSKTNRVYAPIQIVLFGFNLKAVVAWIIAGLPWDCIHGISNFFCGMLIVPIVSVLSRAEHYVER